MGPDRPLRVKGQVGQIFKSCAWMRLWGLFRLESGAVCRMAVVPPAAFGLDGLVVLAFSAALVSAG